MTIALRSYPINPYFCIGSRKVINNLFSKLGGYRKYLRVFKGYGLFVTLSFCPKAISLFHQKALIWLKLKTSNP